MNRLRGLLMRFGGLFGKKLRDQELVAELESHLQMHIEDNLHAGMTPEQARRQALLKLGGLDQTKENVRDRRGFPSLESLLRDVRFSLRALRENPGFTTVAVFTLALGIGANSTIFSWINSTILNPIPGVKHASDYAVLSTRAERDQTTISYRDYVDLRDRNHTFSNIVAADPTPLSIKTKDKPERAWGLWVSANYFEALGVRPIVGRGFLPSEDTQPGGAPVAVISYEFWQTHFGGDRAIGQTIEINRHAFEIVGVAPQGFVGTQTGLSYDLWIPVKMIGALYEEALNPLEKRDENWFVCTGRLKPGVTVVQAQADLNVLMRQIVVQFPDDHRGDFSVAVSPLWRAPFGANFQLHGVLFLLLAIAGVVLLLACANVANLLLVRSIGRAREMAIRVSLGATRWHLVRQSLIESLILSVCGGVVAMVFTLWTAGTLKSFLPPVGQVPLAITTGVDRTVFLATFIVSVLSGIIFGTLPALRASKQQPEGVLREATNRTVGSLRKARLSSALAAAQLALSLLLLVCAGLFIRSVRMAGQFNPGFNPHHVLVDEYDLAGLGYNDNNSRVEFHRRLFDKLHETSGIESATLSDWVPLSFQVQTQFIQPEGYVPQPHESLVMRFADIGPDFFRTLEMPLVAGREFAASDTFDSRLVAVVNAAFADRYWPRADAVGKQVRTKWRSFTVIGVAKNSDYDNLGEKPEPFVYFPLFQQYVHSATIFVRATVDPLAAAASAQDAVHSLDADLPLFNLSTLDSRMTLQSGIQRIAGAFVGGFGIVALLLAGIGIYGVLAYTTRQRTQEIGVRMAFGAQPQSVLRLVLSQGLKLAIIGLAIGLVVSLVLTRALSTVLFGVSPADPLTFVVVIAVLFAAVLLACWLPAWRAMRVDPMVALRYE